MVYFFDIIYERSIERERASMVYSGGGAVWISALEWGSRGRGFKSRPPDQICSLVR